MGSLAFLNPVPRNPERHGRLELTVMTAAAIPVSAVVRSCLLLGRWVAERMVLVTG